MLKHSAMRQCGKIGASVSVNPMGKTGPLVCGGGGELRIVPTVSGGVAFENGQSCT
jgi:hypothetical protein